VNILGMGPMELILIVVLALIVFGPAKLPEIMGQVGKAINDFRKATSDLSEEFNKTIQAELQETKAVVEEAKSVMTDAKSAVSDVHTTVNSAVTGMPAPTRVAEPGEVAGTPTPNGISTEPHAEINGTAPADAKPPLANTAQWSWETSPLPAAAAPPVEATASEPVDTSSAPVEDGPTASSIADTTDEVKPATPAPSDSEPKKGRAAHDDLAPPY
jgi:TatA/E family protein of Tat protein translocase